MSLSYIPGTRYLNPRTYDVATDEVVHGFQVFEQICDGKATGLRSFIDVDGTLVSVELAQMRRQDIIDTNAHKLLWALEALVKAAKDAAVKGDDCVKYAAYVDAEALVRAVKGDTAPPPDKPTLPTTLVFSDLDATIKYVEGLLPTSSVRIVGADMSDEKAILRLLSELNARAETCRVYSYHHELGRERVLVVTRNTTIVASVQSITKSLV